jgi:hypothetical protein
VVGAFGLGRELRRAAQVYSRAINIERRWGERRADERPGVGRRVDDPVRPFESLNLAELLSV